ncbi:MAG TPA: LysR substrate-binding domain-containing protein, partial [Candidatus Competibacteraceae bacterium]|nr:LysR substrate-binding domain-containing protein [Candidatus Competibacteraceae bacterium]
PLDGLADLPRHTLLSAGEALAHVPEIRWLAEHGRNAAVVLRSDSFPVLARAAAAGLGIALLPEALGRDCPGLVPVLPGCRPPPRQAWLVVHKDLRYVARVRAVLEFLAELFVGR